MSEIQKYSLKDELLKKDEEFKDDPALVGISGLTMPRYINSMRSVMFTAHTRQFTTLINPNFPYVFTNMENLVGKHSDSYYQVKHDTIVYKKIVKYEDIVDRPTEYTMFLYDKKKKKYSVVIREEVEDLTEIFGYNYDNHVIDSYEEGDEIPAKTVLFKSTSYDDDMNYRFGENVCTMYTLEPFTSEDAAVVSESYAKRFNNIETEKISVKLNNNDYMLNWYGDETDYRPIPEVGQIIEHGPFCGIRTQYNNQLLFDFKADMLMKEMDGDRLIYSTGPCRGEVIDITIYNNNEEMVETPFNAQIYKYFKAQNKYYQEIYDTCKEIIESGADHSGEINYLYGRSRDMIDTKKRWKEGDSAFSDMVIEFSIRKVRDIKRGQKITGRYGNKSVVAKILPDDQMPYTEDGQRVDLMLNLLAIINRTTSFAIYELCITSICYQVRQKMKEMESYKDKERLLFGIINDFNEIEHDYMWKAYNELDDAGKKKVIDDSINDGIYINISPIHETIAIFYRIQNILNKYDFLKPQKVYINRHGRKILTMTKHWIGSMYIMKLKQTDTKGFSARSSGAVDIKNIPIRSFKSKRHMDAHSDSAIRFGEFETLNFSIAVPTTDIALFEALYRTSPKARKSLIKGMMNINKEIVDVKDDKSYVSRVAEHFNVIFKSLGAKIEFIDDDDVIQGYDDTVSYVHEIDGKHVLCTDYELFLMQREEAIRREVLSENMVMTETQLEKEIKDRLHSCYIVGPLTDNYFDDLYDENGNIKDANDE